MLNLHRPTLLLAVLAASTAALPHLDARATSWCTFYTDDTCSVRSGSVDYDVGNDGIFQNGGPYLSCHAYTGVTLINYSPGDDTGESLFVIVQLGTVAEGRYIGSGSNPTWCNSFIDSSVTGDCIALADYAFITGDGGYYRFLAGTECPSPSRRAVDVTKRDANYLAFYDDSACEAQSGGVDYSTGNDGCFANGGAYASFGGDETDWHIEKWSGVDDAQCSGTMEACATSTSFFSSGTLPLCVHLDDLDLQSGFGSYRIGRGGCP